MASNPRTSNGNLRRKHRARFKAMDAQCGICKGMLGNIHYDEPSDCDHPLSFVIDEIKPISKYYLFGYNSRKEAANDWENLQAAHYVCNSMKSNKLNFKMTDANIYRVMQAQKKKANKKNIIKDGLW